MVRFTLNSKCLLVTIFLVIALSSKNYVAGYSGNGYLDVIRFGGLFDSLTDDQEVAFRLATEVINQNPDILPNHQIIGDAETIIYNDNYATSQCVCKFLSHGVIGIFGPNSGRTSQYVQSICDTMEMPHIETWRNDNPNRGTCSINLHPHPPALARVYVDLVQAWQWKTFTILYENSESLGRINELLKMYDPKGYTVTIRRLDLGIGDQYRSILRQARQSGEYHFVLDCSIEKLPEILKQAQQVGLLTDQYHFIITTLDVHTIDLEPFQHAGTNITGVRLIDPDDPDVLQAAQIWTTLEQRNGRALHKGLLPQALRIESGLIYDAVHSLAWALHEWNFTHVISAKSLDCDGFENWEHGYSLINYMKTMTHKGLTGMIKFDHQGFRSDFQLDIVELTQFGLHKVGTWNSTEGLNLTRSSLQISNDSGLNSLVNRTFRVLTALTPPYGMLKDSPQKLSGNDRFEGFGIDLIYEMSLMLGFNYTFIIQHDSIYGSVNKETGEWNGMIREIRDGRADLAVTDLTITSERENGVDFTMPFMNLGISILYKKPTKMPPELFSFMAPFSSDVWFYLGVSYVGVSLLLFVMGRISPYEWTNPYPCVEEPEVLMNQFSLPNSFWFTVGSLLQQGTEIAPIATSTRMVAGIWWFFTLIMVSSYTANLAAFLTVESTSSPIKNAEDLGNQKVIEYGAKRGGSTAGFFTESNYSTYRRMGEYMTANPHVMTGSNDEGVNRAKYTNYAFLMESTSIEYIIERHCDLTQVGGLLDDKGYGVAMKKNAPYRNALSTAVLKLQESGKLTQMKNKWWKEKRGGGACQTDDSSADVSELGLANVGGVFLVVVVGFICAYLLAFIEMFLGAIGRSYEQKKSLREEVVSELKFFIRCTGLTKPLRSESEEAAENEDNGEDNESAKSQNIDHGPNFNGYPTESYGFVPDITKNAGLK